MKGVFLAYRNSLQADALKLVAKKLQSSLAVEGELPEDGLAAYGDEGDDLMLALARRIVSGEEDAGSVEAAFAQARDAEASAEEYLVDDEWNAVEVELDTVEVNGNGHRDAIEPKVEVVPGNGHHEEAGESQRTLFSWAEFMAEVPVRPKKRSRKPQPASVSLFDWAVGLERERQKELVGARR